jgi:hypothetical protein
VISGQLDRCWLLSAGFFSSTASETISLDDWATGRNGVVIMVDMLAMQASD